MSNQAGKRSRGKVLWDAAAVLEEYRRLTRELGRFPTPIEFDRLAAMTFNCVRRRIGRLEEVREQMKGPEGDRWDVAWLQEEWSQVRVLCGGKSSLFRTCTQPYDLAFVFEHDWPECPGKVLSYRESEAVRRSRRGASGRWERGRRLRRATREEIIAALRRCSARRSGDIDLEEFTGETGIGARDIYLEFASWGALRREAGLPGRRKRAAHRITDSELLDAWVKLKRELGRNPSVHELRRRTPFNHLTYYRRFGLQKDIIRRGEWHERWLDDVAERDRERAEDPDGETGRGLTTTVSRAAVRPKGPAELWPEQRVGFELTSRGAAGWDEHPEILFCVQHDWAAYPGWVVEVREVRGRRGEVGDAGNGGAGAPNAVAGAG